MSCGELVVLLINTAALYGNAAAVPSVCCSLKLCRVDIAKSVCGCCRVWSHIITLSLELWHDYWRRSESHKPRAAKSTLPPHRVIPTDLRSSCFPLNWPDSAAANPTAPLGSTTSCTDHRSRNVRCLTASWWMAGCVQADMKCTFIRSKQSRMAATISSSDTVTTSSTRSRMIGHVRSPGWPFRPSAIVSVLSQATSLPATLEAATSAAPFLPAQMPRDGYCCCWVLWPGQKLCEWRV